MASIVVGTHIVGGVLFTSHLFMNLWAKSIFSNSKEPTKCQEELELLDLESTSLMMMTPSISTITFYDGAAPLESLREKVEKILQQNPWLGGKLRKYRDRVKLQFNNDTQKTDCFSVYEDPLLVVGTNYEDVVSRTKHCVVGDGNSCLSVKGPLFKVTVIVTSVNSFAIFFSMSHVIADGYTYYKLFGMLDSKTPSSAMIINRHHTFSSQLETLMKPNDTFSWAFSLGVTVNILKTLIFSRKPQVFLKAFNLDWIQEQKKAFSGNAKNGANTNTSPFISTNDILTSWYLNLTGCDVGIIAMNFRNRIPALTDEHAGNYEALVAYQREDFARPELIRASLPRYRRIHSGDLPAFPQSMRTRVSLLSSWATVTTEVELDGCAPVVHLPCFENRGIAFDDISVIFKPSKGSIGLFSMSRNLTPAVLSQDPCRPLAVPAEARKA